jgi:RNA 3'-terminal phosphate cyclase-like protein
MSYHVVQLSTLLFGFIPRHVIVPRVCTPSLYTQIPGPLASLQVSPQNSNRIVDGARAVLNKLLADVFIFTDAASGMSAGNSPGYGVALVAETTSGCYISAEACATQVRGRQAGVS